MEVRSVLHGEVGCDWLPACYAVPASVINGATCGSADAGIPGAVAVTRRPSDLRSGAASGLSPKPVEASFLPQFTAGANQSRSAELAITVLRFAEMDRSLFRLGGSCV
jgi:hypothetical protein